MRSVGLNVESAVKLFRVAVAMEVIMAVLEIVVGGCSSCGGCCRGLDGG